MSDIVERLREWNRRMNDGKERMALLKDAADEIERLRDSLAIETRRVNAAIDIQAETFMAETQRDEAVEAAVKARNGLLHDADSRLYLFEALAEDYPWFVSGGSDGQSTNNS